MTAGIGVRGGRGGLRGIAVMVWSAVIGMAAHGAAIAGKGPEDVFRQLDEEFPTPTDTRTASGAPGPAYWQQKVDYRIAVRLDEQAKRIEGEETITYHNNSPDTLTYLWVQLDQNRFRKDSKAVLSATVSPDTRKMPFNALDAMLQIEEKGYGDVITAVTDADGRPLSHEILDSYMRIDLPRPLPPKGAFTFRIAWHYVIPEGRVVGARGGYEEFKDGNAIFFLAQWYPRLAAYTDYGGWRLMPFLGAGEFTVEFGDFDVRITVPADHVVAATGTLQNPDEVLSARQRERLKKAADAERPVFIVTPEEAKDNEKKRDSGTKTWHFRAENVRDFAWASSRKFVWDAKGFRYPSGRFVLAQSFYPNEAMPLWHLYSTESIIQALDVYARITGLEYPWPHADSVNGPLSGGMEYPMITSNGPRPKDPPSYSRREKYALIGVVIHEIGHDWFPMILNSDERRWAWLDEGLNSFVQNIAERLWEKDYPSRRGLNEDIFRYMKGAEQRPIMTAPDEVLQLGNNAYAKVVAALTVLRDVVLGREVFDRAFREYVRRWAFRRPTPYDFFRTMEDASGVDLDWFWRGWFYGTDHVDVAVARVVRARIDTKDPQREMAWKRARDEALGPNLQEKLDAGLQRRVDRDPHLKDFYNEHDEYTVSPKDVADYEKLLEGLSEKEKALLATGKRLTFVTFENLGGLVSPLPLEIRYADGSTTRLTLPAEIWRRDPRKATKLFVTDKEITGIRFDPDRGTGDVDLWNNAWPREPEEITIELTKPEPQRNLMKEFEEAKEGAAGGSGGKRR
ncbi:MAG: aminopeptidase [Rhodothalassiaceae bacterium]|nr:MAG: aminopeptidase [Rhodothalassiaceae bacterium]